MYKTWPVDCSKELQRPELDQLTQAGYSWQVPHDVVSLFEQKVAAFAGSKYAVAVDCCSHGIFLALKYLNASGTVKIPKHTYMSVPMQAMHAGCSVEFIDSPWHGYYQIDPYPIYDGAVRWQKGMYQGGFHVLSFQIKKRIPIGRGGMILTDDLIAYQWLKKSCHDGRTFGVTQDCDNVKSLGWHYYMTPEDAARGILLMDKTPEFNPDTADYTSYIDLTTLDVFKNEN